MYILYDIFTLGVAQFLQFHFVVATTSQLCGNFTLEFDITSTKCPVEINITDRYFLIVQSPKNSDCTIREYLHNP